MRRARRRGKRKGSGHLSISARDAEWDEVRTRAERAGLPIARYVKRLVERDLSRGGTGFTALAPEEQRELLEAMREIRALLREGAAKDREAARAARPEPGKARRRKSSDPPKPAGPEPDQGSLF